MFLKTLTQDESKKDIITIKIENICSHEYIKKHIFHFCLLKNQL